MSSWSIFIQATTRKRVNLIFIWFVCCCCFLLFHVLQCWFSNVKLYLFLFVTFFLYIPKWNKKRINETIFFFRHYILLCCTDWILIFFFSKDKIKCILQREVYRFVCAHLNMSFLYGYFSCIRHFITSVNTIKFYILFSILHFLLLFGRIVIKNQMKAMSLIKLKTFCICALWKTTKMVYIRFFLPRFD